MSLANNISSRMLDVFESLEEAQNLQKIHLELLKEKKCSNPKEINGLYIGDGKYYNPPIAHPSYGYEETEGERKARREKQESQERIRLRQEAEAEAKRQAEIAAEAKRKADRAMEIEAARKILIRTKKVLDVA